MTTHWFIVPELDGPVTGGTLYNRRLVGALRSRGVACRVRTLATSSTTLAQAVPGDWLWLDSLYLDAIPRIAAAVPPGVGLGLMLHYLPSLVPSGSERATSSWLPTETAALREAQAFLVPSPFMRMVLERSVGASRPILHVQPGRLANGPARLPAPPPVRAVMVANLLPGKRIEDFLRALGTRLRHTDRFRLRIVGGETLDPVYARRCRELASRIALRGQVRFLGELPPAETVREMAASNLFISASAMESYGMALAEARTLGLPIVATLGGYVERLVSWDSGGELLGDPSSAAKAFLSLVRNPDRHRRRMAVASACAFPARPWSQAALDFVLQARGLEPQARAKNPRKARGEAVGRVG